MGLFVHKLFSWNVRNSLHTMLVHDHKQTVGSEVSPTGHSKQIEYDNGCECGRISGNQHI